MATESFEEKALRASSILIGMGATEVYIFGSVAQGNVAVNSDLDLAVRGIAPESFYKALGKLLNSLNCSVDLVDLDENTPFVEFLKKNEVLRRVG